MTDRQKKTHFNKNSEKSENIAWKLWNVRIIKFFCFRHPDTIWTARYNNFNSRKCVKISAKRNSADGRDDEKSEDKKSFFGEIKKV